MKFYRTALMKAYFDEGYGFSSYFKYLIAFYGLSSTNVKNTLIIAILYGLSCFIIGWLVYKTKFKDAQIEVINRVNPFVDEMRKTYNGHNQSKQGNSMG